jgi:predicted transcriptional regulator
MKKNRTSTDLAANVLQAAFTPATKTRIMYRSQVYLRYLTPILERLLDKGLVEFNIEARTFVITDRGREFLELYKSMVQDAPLLRQGQQEVRPSERGLNSGSYRKCQSK